MPVYVFYNEIGWLPVEMIIAKLLEMVTTFPIDL